MSKVSHKVYCAGPLFNPKEREEMKSIASALKGAGYSVFLPQEDGIELAKLLPVLIEKDIRVEDATRLVNMAIFSLDVFQIISSDGLVVNMNGRVPDEGAMVEAGIAWAHGKYIVIFRNDDRSLIQGSCNPLVIGLSDFESVSDYGDIPAAFDRRFQDGINGTPRLLESGFEITDRKGKTISEYLSTGKTVNEVVDLLLALFGEALCLNTKKQRQKFSGARALQ